MVGKRHSVKRAHRLALAARGNYGHHFVRVFAYLVYINKYILRHIHIPQLHGGAHHIHHTAPRDCHLASEFCAGVDYLLNTVHIGGKGGDYYALVGIGKKNMLKGGGNSLFRGGKAAALHIGGLAHKQVNALVTVLTQSGHIHHTAVNGGNIQLEVSRMEHRSGGTAHCYGAGVRDRMVYMDKFAGKGAGAHNAARLYRNKLCGFQKLMLRQLVFKYSQSKACTVYGGIYASEHIGQRSDVVLVTVGEKNASDLIGIFLQICYIRYYQIDTKHILVGESKTAVNYDYVVAVFEYRQVFADLAKTAQHHYFQFLLCHIGLLSTVTGYLDDLFTVFSCLRSLIQQYLYFFYNCRKSRRSAAYYAFAYNRAVRGRRYGSQGQNNILFSAYAETNKLFRLSLYHRRGVLSSVHSSEDENQHGNAE